MKDKENLVTDGVSSTQKLTIKDIELFIVNQRKRLIQADKDYKKHVTNMLLINGFFESK